MDFKLHLKVTLALESCSLYQEARLVRSWGCKQSWSDYQTPPACESAVCSRGSADAGVDEDGHRLHQRFSYQSRKTAVEWWQHDAPPGFQTKADHCRITRTKITSVGPEGPRQPPATQKHQNVLSHGRVDMLCHSPIQTEYNSSCYSGTYCSSLLIYEGA